MTLHVLQKLAAAHASRHTKLTGSLLFSFTGQCLMLLFFLIALKVFIVAPALLTSVWPLPGCGVSESAFWVGGRRVA